MPIILFFNFILISSFLQQIHSNTCNHTTFQQPPPPCPPFNTTPPPYPFSTVHGCGHPSFHLHCTANSSLLTINNLTFSLLQYDLSSSTLLLSPLSHQKQPPPCSPPSIPTHPINLTNTPFKISNSYCSRLSLLKPCPPATLSLPNCTRCPWSCSLVRNPSRIFEPGCEPSTAHAPASSQGCHGDVLGYLADVLNIGLLIEYDLSSDAYARSCDDCRRNGVCGFNSSDPQAPFLCFDGESGSGTHDISNDNQSPWIQHHKEKIKLVSLVLLTVCLLSLLVLGYVRVRNRNVRNNNGMMGLEDPTTTFLHRHRCASLLPPVFTYEELEASTNRFDPKRKIGDGGFGSVFLGQLYDGRVVAVKYLHRHHHAAVGGKAVSTKSFCNEILILSSIDHPNLVKLHGYCSDPRGLLLVYDYIPNGTLAEHLHGPNRSVSGPLSWQTRVDVALQVAIAVEYLHFTVEPPIVHRDITTCNIFVDRDMRVRVGDFGLSRLLVYSENRNLSGELSGSSSGCVWTGPQGTPGYLDPDYHRSFRLTEKSDVYSFGVVLLELITGLKAVDQRREKREVALVDMVVAKIQLGLLDQVVDPTLVAEGKAVGESVAAVAELAFCCVAADKDDRPDAREVAAELRRIWSRTRGVKGSNANVVVVPAGTET